MRWQIAGIAALSLLLIPAMQSTSAAHAQTENQPPAPPAGHPPGPPPWAPRWDQQIISSQTLKIGGPDHQTDLQIDFAAGALDLSTAQILPWIQRAATAVVTYYGRFPVPRARILIVPVADRHGVLQGTTWGDMRGFPGFTRMRIGQHTTQQELTEDWTMTHELVHMNFPSLPDDQHWMEEGLATYIEPIARVQAGELKASQVWRDMIDGMPKGEPAPGDQGLDRTHTWGRTYWGGALFCLVADVNIRKETHNRKGLQDALRAIVAAGGTIDHDWPLAKALEVGDKATGTTVLTGLYKQWGESPVQVDLTKLWSDLGVSPGPDGALFDAKAPLSAIRNSIMAH